MSDVIEVESSSLEISVCRGRLGLYFVTVLSEEVDEDPLNEPPGDPGEKDGLASLIDEMELDSSPG